MPPTTAPHAADGAAKPALPTPYRLWLHGLAILLVLGTFSLIALGGEVTSRDAGMAVPDWPGTFGYNVFLAPPVRWFHDHGAFWEHSHRLTGQAIGMITIALTLAIWFTQRRRPWLRWTAIALLGFVIIQGLMGGFRVTENSQFLAAVHGIFGQIILATTVLIAAAVGRFWLRSTADTSPQSVEKAPLWQWELLVLLLPVIALVASISIGGRDNTKELRTWSWFEVGAIWIASMGLYMGVVLWRLVQSARRVWPAAAGRWRGPGLAVAMLLLALVTQLVLGASVRHSGSEKAITDAPLTFGSILPPMSQAGLEETVSELPATVNPPPPDTTIGQVWLHYAHRTLGYLLGAGVVWVLYSVARSRLYLPPLFPSLLLTVGVTLFQITLGIMTIWTEIYPTMATLHQATGAVLLGLVTWLVVRVHLSINETGGTPQEAAAQTRYNPSLSSPASIQGQAV